MNPERGRGVAESRGEVLNPWKGGGVETGEGMGEVGGEMEGWRGGGGGQMEGWRGRWRDG